MSEKIKITALGKHVDALHLSLFGEPRRVAFERLKATKNARRVSELGVIPGVPGGPLMLKPRGRGRHPFIIQNQAFELRLTDGECKASQETCVVRSKSTWQWSIQDPVYRSNTATCRSRSPSVSAPRIEPYDFEAVFYARCCMQTSEKTSSRSFGE
jgi:hypothetical protein